jgi:hypothetical protein
VSYEEYKEKFTKNMDATGYDGDQESLIVSAYIASLEAKVKKLEAAQAQVRRVYDICQMWYNEELSDLDAINMVDDEFIAKGQGLIIGGER